MENSTRPSEPDESGTTQELETDAIGDTAYSRRFVLGVLLKVASSPVDSSALDSAFVEDALCSLWDMTAERCVCELLVAYDAPSSLADVVERESANGRLAEVSLGIVANVCCHRPSLLDIEREVELAARLAPSLGSEDALVVVQALRFASSLIGDRDGDAARKIAAGFVAAEVPQTLAFVMESSLNEKVLEQSAETLDRIASALEIVGEASLIEKFNLKRIVDASLVARRELMTFPSHKESLRTFVSAHRTLADVSADAYSSSSAEELLRTIAVSLTDRLLEDEDPPEDVEELAESAVAIFSSLDCPHNRSLFFAMAALWRRICDMDDSREEFSTGPLTRASVGFFVRAVKLWSQEERVELSAFFAGGNECASSLLRVVREMLESGAVEQYYKDVPDAMRKLMAACEDDGSSQTKSVGGDEILDADSKNN